MDGLAEEEDLNLELESMEPTFDNATNDSLDGPEEIVTL